VLVLPIAGGVLRQAIRRFTIGGEVEKPLIAILVMAVMLVVGVWTARILRREAERTDSLSLQGSALTFSVDAVTHLGVLVALGVVELTGWMMADAIAGILVAVYVLVCTADLVWKSCRDLLDTQVPEEYRRRIIEELREHEGEYLDYHRLRTRRAGSEKHIDFHLTVCRYRTLEETHRLVDHIENALEAIIPQSQVIIHVDPCIPGETCPSEDTCAVSLDRRHIMPESDWPAHPTGAEAREIEKKQHLLDHPDGNESEDSTRIP
jgi:ferrous-iron efflux pump FieF